MRRNFSYSVIIILSSLLLLIAIDATLWLTIQATNYMKGNFNETLLIFAVDLFLIGFAVYIFGRMRPYVKGDVGEESIKYILDKLHGYYYLSDIMIGNRKVNMDCVVIGPTGVWMVEVKNYRKKEIKLDKWLLDDMEQVKYEMKPLQEMLNIPVTPVLVFANKAKIHFGMVPQYGVYVIGKPWLEELITKTSKVVLNPEQCLEIKEKLKPYTSKIS
ncbi:MAG TPA: nuclease-related domain-containing protein [Patescibacteria group bacterium]|nr:nuclease-related domain-containing protein [Patescibacteria group bacterium]